MAKSKSETLLCVIPSFFPDPKPAITSIQKKFPNLKIIFHESKPTGHWDLTSDIQPYLWEEVNILCTLTTFPDPPSIAPNLNLIHVLSAGTNHFSNAPIVTNSQIPITTSNGVVAPTIAEWVIMTSLLTSRKYDLLSAYQKSHSWGDNNTGAEKALFSTISDNVSKRLGILGYGAIGRQVARIAKALGMDVIVFTANSRDTVESKKDTSFVVPGTGDEDGSIPSRWFSGKDKASLHHFLAQDIDHLLISLPLTPETKHLLGKEEFEILGRRNAFVSNIARGEVIVQEDLIEALRAFENDSEGVVGGGRKGLKGAALDVTTPEPLPEDSPLWDAPNCIVTPHMSGLSEAYSERALQVLEINLERREKGEGYMNLMRR